MSTEPKPESPAELAAEAKRLAQEYASAETAAFAVEDALDSDGRSREAWSDLCATIDRLAALATIQASASASQEPICYIHQEQLDALANGTQEAAIVYAPEKGERMRERNPHSGFRPLSLYTAATQQTACASQEPVAHRQGCPALGGYGHGVGACECGATQARPASGEAWQTMLNALRRLMKHMSAHASVAGVTGEALADMQLADAVIREATSSTEEHLSAWSCQAAADRMAGISSEGRCVRHCGSDACPAAAPSSNQEQ